MTLVMRPEQFSAWVEGLPPGTSPAPAADADALVTLRQRSTTPAAAVDPLAIPGGAAGEQAWRDQEAHARQQLKRRLATAKLHGGLLVAALGYEARARDHGQPTDERASVAVSAYVERAARWIEETAAAFESHGHGAGERPVFANYHRYEMARALVALLERRPALLEEIAPARMGSWLTSAPAALPQETAPATAWCSVGAEADERMAWARALARVVEAALQAPFNRELPVLLDDARQAIAAEVERQTQPLTGGQPLPLEALRIVRMHALKSASRLYAATLARVHHESARMIQTYQELTNQGDAAAADRCARAYQERHLGYAGVPHHYREITALHERWVAALAVESAPHDATNAGPPTGNRLPSTRMAP